MQPQVKRRHFNPSNKAFQPLGKGVGTPRKRHSNTKNKAFETQEQGVQTPITKRSNTQTKSSNTLKKKSSNTQYKSQTPAPLHKKKSVRTSKTERSNPQNKAFESPDRGIRALRIRVLAVTLEDLSSPATWPRLLCHTNPLEHKFSITFNPWDSTRLSRGSGSRPETLLTLASSVRCCNPELQQPRDWRFEPNPTPGIILVQDPALVVPGSVGNTEKKHPQEEGLSTATVMVKIQVQENK